MLFESYAESRCAKRDAKLRVVLRLCGSLHNTSYMKLNGQSRNLNLYGHLYQLLYEEDRAGFEMLQINFITITCLSHHAHLKHNLGVVCSDQRGILFNMCRWERSKAPPGCYFSVENLKSSQKLVSQIPVYIFIACVAMDRFA